MRPAPTGNNTDNVVIPKHLRDVTIVSKKAKQHAQFGHNIQVILFVDCILYYLHCCLLAFFILSIQQCAALHAFALNVFIIAVWFFLLKKKGLPACRQSGLHIVHLHWRAMCECGWFWLAIYCFHGFQMLQIDHWEQQSSRQCAVLFYFHVEELDAF